MSLSESDTRSKLIDPALHRRGWTEDLIKREETAGAIYVADGRAYRKPSGRSDYTLRIKVGSNAQALAVAVIEAKAEHLPPTHGMEQAKDYARRLNVPFVIASNGHLFVEYDNFTGLTTSPRPIAEFPTPADLRSRYEQAKGFSLDDEAAKPLLMPYKGGEATRRYYQDAAIRAVLEKLARCEKTGDPKRALLALATGSGKTFIAVNLLRKIADAGQLKRALFVCDRDELRKQGHLAFQNTFGSDAAAVSTASPQRNARIVIATYQTLGVDSEEADASFLIRNYPENYFSHIVIDECHRSAWGKWSQVLTRNPNAVQVGLTATPRRLKIDEDSREAQSDTDIIADNIRYFGEPIYEYDISQGIEDGYLAACEIQMGRVNLDEQTLTIDEIMKRKPRNANTGEMMTREEVRDVYTHTQYEDRILLPDRVFAMCGDLFDYLSESACPEQKTIVFCVSDRHADDVANTINNMYALWCKANGRKPVSVYAFKCTAASNGSDFLPDFRGSSAHHFVATTVDLLSTGVDVPCLENIVFFKYVNSPISFYQMIGRGTRLNAPTGKMMFRVYDYTNATRLFGQEFITSQPKKYEPKPPLPPVPPIIVEGFEVHVNDAGKFIVTQVDGKAVPVTLEEYRERVAASLVEEARTLADFRVRWVQPEQRRELLHKLPDGGRSAIIVQTVDDKLDFDLYDVLGELGFGLAARTRQQRADAFVYKSSDWLESMPVPTAATIKAVASQFAKGGTDGLENQYIFRTPEVQQAGGIPALESYGNPRDLLHETKVRMFEV
jgi:type I restriction enzyme R subunit